MSRCPARERVRPLFSRLRGGDGFTLVEVLVAFLVLSLFAVALHGSVTGTLDAGLRAQARIGAAAVARTLMAGPVPVDARTRAAGRMDGHEWTVRYEPLGTAVGAAGSGPAAFRPMRVIVEVAAGRAAPVRVETVRLVPSPGAGS